LPAPSFLSVGAAMPAERAGDPPAAQGGHLPQDQRQGPRTQERAHTGRA
jgi:hypothetical protein